MLKFVKLCEIHYDSNLMWCFGNAAVFTVGKLYKYFKILYGPRITSVY